MDEREGGGDERERDQGKRWKRERPREEMGEREKREKGWWWKRQTETNTHRESENDFFVLLNIPEERGGQSERGGRDRQTQTKKLLLLVVLTPSLT